MLFASARRRKANSSHAAALDATARPAAPYINGQEKVVRKYKTMKTPADADTATRNSAATSGVR